jgi:hypothetical protein
MKTLIPYIVLFLGTLLTATLIVVAVMAFAPGLFGPTTEAAPEGPPAPVDIALMYGPTPADLHGVDSLALARSAVVRLRDSLDRYAAALAAERARADSLQGRAGDVPGAGGTAAAETTAATPVSRVQERKSVAKMLEAMQPESAARVLRDMPDEDVKNLLLNVKRKQAAKILSALDPDRAAKIMR